MKMNQTQRCFLVLLAVLFLCGCSGAKEPSFSPEGTAEGFSVAESDAEPARRSSSGRNTESVIYVYICGAVKSPGVFEL